MSMKAWTNHIDGSIALLNLRGTDLLKSEFGLAIFTQIRAQIVSYSILASLYEAKQQAS